MSKSLKTKDTILPAWEMALSRRKPGKGMIFHSDRGVQYASDEFRKVLKKCKNISYTIYYFRIRRSLYKFKPENYSIEISLHNVTIQNARQLIIHYSIDKDQEIMLRMYDRIGEQVVTKVMPFNEAGEHLYYMSLEGVKSGNYLIQIVQVLSNKIVAEQQFKL